MPPALWSANVGDSPADRLISATLCLLSAYGERSTRHDGGPVCPRLALTIYKHMQALGECCESGSLVRATAMQLMDSWEPIAAQAMACGTACPMAAEGAARGTEVITEVGTEVATEGGAAVGATAAMTHSGGKVLAFKRVGPPRKH
jgi:hypothetical protein